MLENPDVPGVLPCGTTVRGLAWTRCATPFATSRRSTSDPSTPRKMTKNSREDSRSVGRTREQSGGLKSSVGDSRTVGRTQEEEEEETVQPAALDHLHRLDL